MTRVQIVDGLRSGALQVSSENVRCAIAYVENSFRFWIARVAAASARPYGKRRDDEENRGSDDGA